ncbi:MAG: PKD domain-containing protein [Myxococcota bacterium]
MRRLDIDRGQWTVLALCGALILAGCSGGAGGSGADADSEAPSMPGSVMADASSPVTITVSWTASSDNVGVVAYDVQRDGVYLLSVTSTSVLDSGLQPGVPHCYSVLARDAAGNASAASPVVCATTVNLPPLAALSATESELIGTDVSFDASASSDPDGTIVQYAFDFGDGSAIQVVNTPSVAHAYSTEGNYAPRVTITDDLGAHASATVSVTIGMKLSTPVNVSRTGTISQSANAFHESDGSIDVVWEEFGVDLLMARSIDGGQSFTDPTYVIDPNGFWGSNNDFSAGQARVLEAGGTLHVVTTLFDELYGGAEVFHVGSSDDGSTFGDPVLVSTDDGINSVAPAIDAEGDGSVSIAWQNSNLDTGENSIGYARSIDDGATFSPPKIVSAPPSYAGCAQVLWSASDVLALWTEGSEGSERILASRTVDHGVTFGTPVEVDLDPAKSWCATAVRDAGGTVYAVWEEGDAWNTRIRFARSTDRGVSFSMPVTISAPDRDATCPSIEVGDGRLVVTWTYRENFILVDSYLTASTDGGASFSTPLRIAFGEGGGACYQVVSGSPTNVGLVWHAAPAAGEQSDVFYGTAQLSTF